MPNYELTGDLKVSFEPNVEVLKKTRMAPRSVLVTGANRGIGLGLVKRMLENDGVELVIAGCRTPDQAKELNDLKSDSRLHVIALDVDCDKSINNAFEQVSKLVGEHGLTVLLNNAGILLPYDVEGEINRSTMIRQLTTNSISTAILTQTFLPLLKKSAESEKKEGYSVDKAAIINISSTAASVEKIDGTFNGPLAAYRMSKSALNSFAKTCSVDLAKYHILVTSFCPGWVRTDMGGSNADIEIDESTKQLAETIFRLDGSNHGGYYDRFLTKIPN